MFAHSPLRQSNSMPIRETIYVYIWVQWTPETFCIKFDFVFDWGRQNSFTSMHIYCADFSGKSVTCIYIVFIMLIRESLQRRPFQTNSNQHNSFVTFNSTSDFFYLLCLCVCVCVLNKFQNVERWFQNFLSISVIMIKSSVCECVRRWSPGKVLRHQLFVKIPRNVLE